MLKFFSHRRQDRFQALTLPHLDRLLAFARRRIGDPTLAEDIVQETYLRAWQHFADLKEETRVKPWLDRILLNLLHDHFRQHERRMELLPITDLEDTYWAALASDAAGPFEETLTTLSDERVQQALARLPSEFALVIELCDIEGYKYREIAEILEAPIGTVMSRITRGRRLLAAIILNDRSAWGLSARTAAQSTAEKHAYRQATP